MLLRPTSFLDFIGNDKVKDMVMGLDKRPHLIVVKGVEGSGKSSLARLIIKKFSKSNIGDLTAYCAVGRDDDYTEIPDVVELYSDEAEGLDDFIYDYKNCGADIFYFTDVDTMSTSDYTKVLDFIKEDKKDMFILEYATDITDIPQELFDLADLVLEPKVPALSLQYDYVSDILKDFGFNVSPDKIVSIIDTENMYNTVIRLDNYIKELK